MNMKMTRNQQLRVLMIAAAAIIAILIGFAVYLKVDRTLPMPMKYTNQNMVYVSSEASAMQTKNSFTADLCVSSEDVSNENITMASDVHAALFSLDDRQVIYSKGMYDKIYPASVTKIMTAILAFKYGNMDETVTINWQDVDLETGSQVAGLQIGDQVKMGALVRALLVHSGNDAAQAVARNVGGTTEKFVQMMNEELEELGCTGSHFVNPTGLHNEDHYTTVYDIYLMLNAAVQYPDFVNIMHVAVYDLQYTDKNGNAKNINLDSTDYYLTGSVDPPKNVTVLGGKTGTTSAAGHNLAIESQNAYGQPYISIVIGAQTTDLLYENMNVLLSQIN